MTQKKEAPATTASTPLKDKGKDTNFNQHYIDILIYILFFELGYLFGIVGGLGL